MDIPVNQRESASALYGTGAGDPCENRWNGEEVVTVCAGNTMDNENHQK